LNLLKDSLRELMEIRAANPSGAYDPVRDKRSRIARKAELTQSGLPPEVGETSSGCARTRRLCTATSMR